MILLSNDDGIHAPGLAALAEVLAELDDITVVAPATEQSARSHGLTMHRPLRVQQLRPGWLSVSGTPADSVYMALHHLCPQPDIVVSGINRGSNLGNDVHYSGTVAAAREAALNGIPALAVSLFTEGEDVGMLHWETASRLARAVVLRMREAPLPPGVLLNLNTPNLPKVRGLRICPLGERRYTPLVRKEADPRGKAYYWIGGPPQGFVGGDHTDGAMVSEGFASLTPMRTDVTAHTVMALLREWES